MLIMQKIEDPVVAEMIEWDKEDIRRTFGYIHLFIPQSPKFILMISLKSSHTSS